MTITLPYSEALLAGIGAVALHASKDDVTPVICAVRVDSETFVATDRYSVGEWKHTPAADAVEAEPVLIPRKTAEWLAKQTHKVLGVEWLSRTVQTDAPSALVIVFEEDAVTIRHRNEEHPEHAQVLAVQRFAAIEGNFPPVARLFPKEGEEPKPFETGGPVALNPLFLEKFTAGAKKIVAKNDTMHITVQGSDKPGRPGPVFITFGAFRGLLQPHYLRR